MVTVYTELSIKDQKHNKLATLNHNQQENSNLIMPFLVQNDNKMIKGLTTLIEGFFKKSLFFLKMRSISPRCIKLYLLTIKHKIEGKSFADWCLGMCLMWNIKSKINEGTRKTCYRRMLQFFFLKRSINKNLRYCESV